MKKHKIRNMILACAVIAAIVIAIAVPASRGASKDEVADSIQSITETVQKLALQCYVIEGAYPTGLDYLEENYGLTVNKEDFLIMYSAFAENLPPDVKVLYRKGNM